MLLSLNDTVCSNSTFPLTQSRNEGSKMWDAVLINTNVFANDLRGFITAAACERTCVCLLTSLWSDHLQFSRASVQAT